MEATPKHLIIVDGAILQPIPEHPKRDFIFCLSTAFGDAYLFQVRSSGPYVLKVPYCPARWIGPKVVSFNITVLNGVAWRIFSEFCPPPNL